VLAPGITSSASQKAIWQHCELLADRVAVLDFAVDADISKFTSGSGLPSGESSYAAADHPWLPVPSLTGAGHYVAPQSGHIAGLYARVDAARGVHKAPANEVLFNVVDVQQRYPASLQDKVNPYGVNLIRQINGNPNVWGARTLGGQDNIKPAGDFKY